MSASDRPQAGPWEHDPRRPYPRWVILPGDPAPLAQWLAAQAAARGEALPDNWPTEEPR